ncbi:MAG TPA: hypothetical protein DCQ06_11405 [Myxococcales bacterium]|nr:hypothetical protein [Myxococcales bacterium]HAN32195.1 hypothetical protein [Myxococcales bacterium]
MCAEAADNYDETIFIEVAREEYQAELAPTQPWGSDMRRLIPLITIITLVAASHAAAQEVWKYDDGPDDLGSLAGTKMHPQFGHPGFIQGEAWGVLFRPEKEKFPIEILGVELVMAAPTTVADATAQKMNAVIEFWNDDSDAANPSSSKPLWSVNTSDFFNPVTGKPGTPIQGNTVMKYEFSSSKPGDKPPVITQGNIRVMIRVSSQAKDLSTYWGKTDCMKQQIAGIDVGCGCQDLAALTDSATTVKTQLMHIVWPLGQCSGSKAWRFVEEINSGLVQMKGDFRLRLVVKSNGGGGGTTDAGGSSGTDSGSTSDTGVALDAGPAPSAKPVIDLINPSAVPSDKPTEIEIIGDNFVSGAVVKVGAAKTSVMSVTATKIVTTVLPGITPGTYPVVVENPDGQVGFKDAAVTVTAAVEPDAGPVDAGTVTPVDPLTIDMVDPRCVESARDTSITVFGSGFAQGISLQVGGKELLAIQVQSSSKLTALVPKGLPTGEHSLIATLNGKQVAMANGIEVDCGSKGVDSGCSASGKPDQRALWLMAVMFGGLLLRRRRFAKG